MGGNALQEAVVVSMGGVCPLGAERVGRGPSSYRGRGGSHPEGRSHTALSCCAGVCSWLWASELGPVSLPDPSSEPVLLLLWDPWQI